MSANERLQELQSALEQRGVRDVKFYFSLSTDKPASEVANDVADYLQAYLDGHFTPVQSIGDSKPA